MNVKRFYAIAACDPKGVLGKSGRLPWHYPEDLQHFAKTTCNHIIVMGFRSYLTFPKKYCKERLVIVFSRQHQMEFQKKSNVIIVNSLQDFLSLKCLSEGKDVYISGGAQIYTLFLQSNLIKELVLTELKQSYEGDVFLPLSLIRDWPRKKVQENKDFAIYHYLNE